jgi:hypothetical protein
MSAIGPVGWEDTQKLRDEFVRLLTEDSETHDARRREFNQALFMPDGKPVWTETTLSMVLEKYDKAVRSLGSRP